MKAEVIVKGQLNLEGVVSVRKNDGIQSSSSF